MCINEHLLYVLFGIPESVGRMFPKVSITNTHQYAKFPERRYAAYVRTVSGTSTNVIERCYCVRLSVCTKRIMLLFRERR